MNTATRKALSTVFLILLFPGLLLPGLKPEAQVPPEIGDLGREPAISRIPGSPPPQHGVLDGLTQVSKEQWGEREVRLILQTFAYGGQTSDRQIATWSRMTPSAAIVQMLNFDPVNLRLSPLGARDPSAEYCHSLEALQDFWSSDRADNPMRFEARPFYATLGRNNPVVSPTHLYLAWSRLMHTPGCNGFLHKLALYITNYHASIHIQNSGPSLIRSYYDDVVEFLSGGADFVELMTMAASHAALARAYGHTGNHFDRNREFNGNDDFAREYFQLLFGIQGTTEDEVYHEDVTIEHNAWLLTGMLLDMERGAWGSERRQDWFVAPIGFSNHRDAAGRNIPNQSIHFRSNARDESCLEILHEQICGPTALDKLIALGPVAASHPESMAAIPVKLIRFLGDDGLGFEEITALQTAWSAANFDLLSFVWAYATSTQFLEGDAFKFKSAFDRNLAIQNANQITVEEAYAKSPAAGPFGRIAEQGAIVFAPIRDVFGGQTGADAANDRFVFKNAWDANVTNPWHIAQNRQDYRPDEESDPTRWQKDWSEVIPTNQRRQHVVNDVGEWLWNHFIGDGGENYDDVARSQVNALLATGLDFGAFVDRDLPGELYGTAELATGEWDEYLERLAETTMNLESGGANVRVGLAINFITALPFSFASGVNQ